MTADLLWQETRFWHIMLNLPYVLCQIIFSNYLFKKKKKVSGDCAPGGCKKYKAWSLTVEILTAAPPCAFGNSGLRAVGSVLSPTPVALFLQLRSEPVLCCDVSAVSDLADCFHNANMHLPNATANQNLQVLTVIVQINLLKMWQYLCLYFKPILCTVPDWFCMNIFEMPWFCVRKMYGYLPASLLGESWEGVSGMWGLG